MAPYYIHSVTAGGTIDYDAAPYHTKDAALDGCRVYLKNGCTFIHVVQWISGKWLVAADFDAVKQFVHRPGGGEKAP
jgi:hypothetical protein